MKKIIYADNAATTQMSEKACEEMMKFFRTDFANASQPYAFARHAKKVLNTSREMIADCLGASPNEIYFTSCGTESDNWVIQRTKNKRIITSQIEHHAILNSCSVEESKGRIVTYLPVTETGCVLPETLSNFIEDNCLVSIMYSNNEIGTIEPIHELVKIAHQKDCLFHTDAIQAVGHIQIDVKTLNVDFLSASAHKFNGPKGIGFLYIKEGIQLEPLISGGAQEFGHRAGTENVASIVAMAVALNENITHLEANTTHINSLKNLLLSKLFNAGVKFKCNGAEERIPGSISISFPNHDGEALLHRLDLQGICISTGSACDSHDTQISHVLKAIGLDDKYAKGTIRISLGKNNTEEDVLRIVETLIRIVGPIR